MSPLFYTTKAPGAVAMSCLIDAAVDSSLYPGPTTPCPCQTFDVNGVQCMYHPGPPNSLRYIVYLHGNVMTLGTLYQSGIIPMLSRICDAHVIVPEYPGYGDLANVDRGSGEAADNAMFANVHSVIDNLRDRDIRNIVVMGRSVGTGVALGALARQQGSGHAVSHVVLVSPFTCVCDLAPFGMQWLVPRRLDNASNIALLPNHIKTVVIHGIDDTFVPFQQGKQLSTKRPNCTFVPIKGMGHAINAAQFADVARATRAFLGPAAQSTDATRLAFDIFGPQSSRRPHSNARPCMSRQRDDNV